MPERDDREWTRVRPVKDPVVVTTNCAKQAALSPGVRKSTQFGIPPYPVTKKAAKSAAGVSERIEQSRIDQPHIDQPRICQSRIRQYSANRYLLPMMSYANKANSTRD